jgi:hypothetical protein
MSKKISATDQSLTPHPRLSYFVSIVFVIFLCCICKSLARADDTDDAVDKGFEAMQSIGGAIAGVQLSERDVEFAKPLVKCVLHGREVLDCARDIVISLLPPEIEREVRPVMGCLIAAAASSSDNVAACNATEVLERMPADLAKLVICLSRRENISSCASEVAAGSLPAEILEVIRKLDADGRDPLSEVRNARIRRIVRLCGGIRDNEWEVVVHEGGVEVGKAAAKIVFKAVIAPLNIVLVIPNELVDQIIDSMIEIRVQAFEHLLEAVQTGRPEKIVEAIIVYELTSRAFPICDLLAESPIDIYELTCGNFSKIVQFAAGGASDLVGEIIRESLGIVDDVFGDNCTPPDQYFSENYQKCLHRGAYLALLDQSRFDQFTGTQEGFGGLDEKCHIHYDGCTTSSNFPAYCDGQRDQFRQLSANLAKAIQDSANEYVRSIDEFAKQQSASIVCNSDPFSKKFELESLPEFAKQCEKQLSIHFKLPTDAMDEGCGGTPRMGRMSLPFTTVYAAACQRAIDSAIKPRTSEIALKACKAHKTTPGAPTGCSVRASCASIFVKCDAPLPEADWYNLSPQEPGHTEKEMAEETRRRGNIMRDGHAGLVNVRMCAGTLAGVACSPNLTADVQGPCTNPPPIIVIRPCPLGETRCDQRCRPFIECTFEQSVDVSKVKTDAKGDGN